MVNIKLPVIVQGFMVQRFRNYVQSDPLIHEFCDLPHQCQVTVGVKTRGNNWIVYEHDQLKKGNPDMQYSL